MKNRNRRPFCDDFVVPFIFIKSEDALLSESISLLLINYSDMIYFIFKYET